ncbi:DUF6234 family protein [Streptomyces sp. NPDC001984]|uniref:DUF6234 family protein n=1 Tax=Streptomyces sp. NPDC002619 TaxID=3364655 RepID=UPI0036B45266
MHPLADVVLALLLLALDAGVALITYLYALAQAGYAFFDAGADNSDVSMTAPAVGLAVLGLAVLATALLAGRGRAIVTACGQTLAGLALLGVAAVALVLQYHDDHPPAPGRREAWSALGEGAVVGHDPFRATALGAQEDRAVGDAPGGGVFPLADELHDAPTPWPSTTVAPSFSHSGRQCSSAVPFEGRILWNGGALRRALGAV